MLFNSLKYALFLPIVVTLFWLSPQRFRVGILLLASYIFYMSWRPAYILLIIGLTIFNYYAGLLIHRSTDHKKNWLTLAIVGNLSTLVFFKYAYFFDDLLSGLLKPAGILLPKIPFDIILPLGISFFVFEFIHYVMDIYRGSEPVKSFFGFALFASFFPTQIAGPIKRFQDFVPQFLTPAKFCIDHFDSGVTLILTGLFKKVLIADNLSLFVQGGFAHPELFSGPDLWLFTYGFAFQIYFDFSGYTDIARGSAMLFGYKVPLNFNLPYLAGSIADFWHRWHISLSTWLRDYLFIPLGGSRCSRLKQYRNLFITMTLGGLWHGAAVHFLLWGIYHGLMLVLHREWIRLTGGAQFVRSLLSSLPGRCFATLFTFHAVCVGWVLFRAETAQSAAAILEKLFFLDVFTKGTVNLKLALTGINYPLIYPAVFILLPILAGAHLVCGWLSGRDLLARTPKLLKAIYCLALICLIVVFSPDQSPRFIYFQF